MSTRPADEMPGIGSNLLQQRPVVLLVRGRSPIERQHLHRHQAVRVEPEIHGGDAHEAANHQAGAGDQDDRQRDLGGNQQLTAAPRQRRAGLPAAARQHRSDAHA